MAEELETCNEADTSIILISSCIIIYMTSPSSISNQSKGKKAPPRCVYVCWKRKHFTLHLITYTRTVILSEDFVVRFSFHFKSCVIGSVSANNYSPWQNAAPSITMTSSTRTPPENPRIIALFDVDGTLTIPRGEITEEMMDFMKALGKKITGTCMIACWLAQSRCHVLSHMYILVL